MRRLLAFFIVATLATGASAEVRWEPRVLVHGGLAIPVSPEDFADASSLGFAGGIGFGFRMAPPIMIVGSVDYSTFGLDEEGFKRRYDTPDGLAVAGGEVSTLYASIGLRVIIPSEAAAHLYLTGGLGYFRYVPDDVQVDGMTISFESEDTTGLHGGAGVDISMGPYLNLFFEAIVVVGFTETELTTSLPLRAGIAFDIVPNV